MPAEIDGVVLDVDGVLTDGLLYYGPDGEAMKSFHVRDGLGLALLRKHGVRMAIISGRASNAVQERADELGIDPCLLARLDKGEALAQVCEAWDTTPDRLAAIGDDLVDLPMLRKVGWSFAPADADPRVRAVVDVVTEAEGGRGAVRELAERVLRATGKWEAIAAHFHGGGDD